MGSGKRLKKVPLSKLHNKIWLLCKEIIRKRYGNICYTCGATGLDGSNWHTGHLISKSVCGLYLKYDLRNLRPQCARCNIWGGGMGAEFVRRMEMLEGNEYVENLFQGKTVKVKNSYDFLTATLEEYKKILKS